MCKVSRRARRLKLYGFIVMVMVKEFVYDDISDEAGSDCTTRTSTLDIKVQPVPLMYMHMHMHLHLLQPRREALTQQTYHAPRSSALGRLRLVGLYGRTPRRQPAEKRWRAQGRRWRKRRDAQPTHGRRYDRGDQHRGESAKQYLQPP